MCGRTASPSMISSQTRGWLLQAEETPEKGFGWLTSVCEPQVWLTSTAFLSTRRIQNACHVLMCRQMPQAGVTWAERRLAPCDAWL